MPSPAAATSPASSIVIPAYRAERYVAEAVRSVLGQSDRDFELIVWDDGSDDGTADAAEAAIGGDPRGRVVRAEHRGVSGALRGAFAEARGALIGQVDADDRLHPSALRACRARLASYPGAGFVYTRHREIDSAGRVLRTGRRCRIPFDPNRMLIDFMTFHFRLIRREAYERSGGWDPAYLRAADYDLCLRLAEVAAVRHVPRVLYDYRVHRSSISVASREEQTQASLRAVNAALRRRGQADRYAVVLTEAKKFRLVER
jgi:glycosyltransferase involved in cell wall biosynthesis